VPSAIASAANFTIIVAARYQAKNLNFAPAQSTSENDSDEILTESPSAVMPRPHAVILMFHNIITLSRLQA
jgi:hypothetical protein